MRIILDFRNLGQPCVCFGNGKLFQFDSEYCKTDRCFYILRQLEWDQDRVKALAGEKYFHLLFVVNEYFEKIDCYEASRRMNKFINQHIFHIYGRVFKKS